jgi:hypothetical protein
MSTSDYFFQVVRYLLGDTEMLLKRFHIPLIRNMARLLAKYFGAFCADVLWSQETRTEQTE